MRQNQGARPPAIWDIPESVVLVGADGVVLGCSRTALSLLAPREARNIEGIRRGRVSLSLPSDLASAIRASITAPRTSVVWGVVDNSWADDRGLDLGEGAGSTSGAGVPAKRPLRIRYRIVVLSHDLLLVLLESRSVLHAEPSGPLEGPGSPGVSEELRRLVEAVVEMYDGALSWVVATLEDAVAQRLVGLEMLLGESSSLGGSLPRFRERLSQTLRSLEEVTSFLTDRLLRRPDPARAVLLLSERTPQEPGDRIVHRGGRFSGTILYLVGRDLVESIRPVDCDAAFEEGWLRIRPTDSTVRFPPKVVEAKRRLLESLGGRLHEESNPYGVAMSLH